MAANFTSFYNRGLAHHEKRPGGQGHRRLQPIDPAQSATRPPCNRANACKLLGELEQAVRTTTSDSARSALRPGLQQSRYRLRGEFDRHRRCHGSHPLGGFSLAYNVHGLSTRRHGPRHRRLRRSDPPVAQSRSLLQSWRGLQAAAISPRLWPTARWPSSSTALLRRLLHPWKHLQAAGRSGYALAVMTTRFGWARDLPRPTTTAATYAAKGDLDKRLIDYSGAIGRSAFTAYHNHGNVYMARTIRSDDRRPRRFA